MKDVFALLPVEQQKQVIEGMIDFVDKYRKEGSCKEIYNISSIKGSASIWEMESAERAATLLLENPGSPYQDYEMFILSNFDTLIREQKKKYDRQLIFK